MSNRKEILYDNEIYVVELANEMFADGNHYDVINIWFHDLPIGPTKIKRPSGLMGRGVEVLGRTIGDSLKDAYNSGKQVGAEKVQKKITGALGL